MKNKALVFVLALLAAGAAIGFYGARTFFKPAPSMPGLASPQDEETPAVPSNLPALETSDDLVRSRAGALSSARAFQEWLKQEALISRLTAALNMIANGNVPREIFAGFAPREKFSIAKRDGAVSASPAAYARFDGFAAMVQGVDAVATARLFEELLPLFDAAQSALGERNADARATFLAAIRELLAAPLAEDAAALKEGKKGVGWDYADERLQSLSPAQKQLMRMGPKNQMLVQTKLRAVSLALGSPVSRP
ncbi:MAG: hypothetical protein COV48_10435 [Elusimicrobia bacterium CG11_big_fil_rev_8_21_14_0_20_64_6]|nr:MAG: hypothetical protein COV48_10435 [Elusimicrobia bacterium CG11_big_fil_rev_8_21_14_0_20_64_6]